MSIYFWRSALCALLCSFASVTLASDDGAESKTHGPQFDAQLAAKLGADDYGMRKYVMALLKAGPNRDQGPEQAAELQRAHMANIQRMADEGVLVLAGPFLDKGELRGIYVFDVATVEEARKLTETDPAVKAGRLVMELHPWYGSAAIKQLNAVHQRISQQAP
ncbi:YciI family protein [Microbulbifer sp. ALW1]|uniref:YciI family protein n=1 Tax=Microbulbifer sp. (strain ALW1) TaxID=1516059 RepID=UPI00135B86C7|nr:YciI family protein [Microbulbifer sp. ALW1]